MYLKIQEKQNTKRVAGAQPCQTTRPTWNPGSPEETRNNRRHTSKQMVLGLNIAQQRGPLHKSAADNLRVQEEKRKP